MNIINAIDIFLENEKKKNEYNVNKNDLLNIIKSRSYINRKLYFSINNYHNNKYQKDIFINDNYEAYIKLIKNTTLEEYYKWQLNIKQKHFLSNKRALKYYFFKNYSLNIIYDYLKNHLLFEDNIINNFLSNKKGRVKKDLLRIDNKVPVIEKKKWTIQEIDLLKSSKYFNFFVKNNPFLKEFIAKNQIL